MALILQTDVPFGNACDVSVDESCDPPLVRFAADPHGGPETLWFCFRVRRTGPGESAKITLELAHFDNILGCSNGQHLRPVVRCDDAPWTRLAPGTEHLCWDERRRVRWESPPFETTLDVAVCYPYGRAEVQALLDETSGYWRCDTIGVSQQARPILRLSNSEAAVTQDTPGLYLIARQHSGETPGSWVLDGLLRRLAEVQARQVLVWTVPLSNIDGIEQGDYGKDNFPYDLNRAWGHPPMRHETLLIRRDMDRWGRRCRPKLAIDFHAPGACEATGAYAYVPDPETWHDAWQQLSGWTQAIEKGLGQQYASAEFTRVARYKSRWETPSFATYCWGVPGLAGFSLETPYGSCGETVLTMEAYREIGSRLADAVLAHLNTT